MLAALRQVAESQGRQLQAVFDEALGDYIDRQPKERSRRHVTSSFAQPRRVRPPLSRTGQVNRAAREPDHQRLFVADNKRVAFAAADVVLHIDGWRLQRSPIRIHAKMMQMIESGTFDIAQLDLWLRDCAKAEEQ